MAYIEKRYKGINTIEHEIIWNGHYGQKGEKRAPKKKRTPEQIARQNQINKENRVRRSIQANFYPNDYWITLNYPQGTRKPYKDVKYDFDIFARSLRKEYRIRGEPLKYLYRIEIGKLGGIHIHFLINRIWGTDLLVQKTWPGGRSHFTHLREEGGYRRLAAYLTKPLPYEKEVYLKLGMDEKDIKAMTKYGCSRNLEHPEPERKSYRKKTVRRLLTEGPKPSPGFYIDKESVHIGINPYTGTSYMSYSEIRLEQIERCLKPPEEINAGKYIRGKQYKRRKG